jgi:hypothetical protein
MNPTTHKDRQTDRAPYFPTNVWKCFKMFQNVQITFVKISSTIAGLLETKSYKKQENLGHQAVWSGFDH